MTLLIVCGHSYECFLCIITTVLRVAAATNLTMTATNSYLIIFFVLFQDQKVLKNTLVKFDKRRKQVEKRYDEVAQNWEELDRELEEFLVESGLQKMMDSVKEAAGVDPTDVEDLIAWADEHKLKMKQRNDRAPVPDDENPDKHSDEELC